MGRQLQRLSKVADQLGVNASARIILAERLLMSLDCIKEEFIISQRALEAGGCNDAAIELFDDLIREQRAMLGILKHADDSGRYLLQDLATKHAANMGMLEEAVLAGTDEYFLSKLRDAVMDVIHDCPNCRAKTGSALVELENEGRPIVRSMVTRRFGRKP